MRRALGLVCVLWLVGCAGGGDEVAEVAGPEAVAPEVELVDPPAEAGALAPRLVRDGEGALLSWLEPVEEGVHRLRVARFDGTAWGAASTVVEGEDVYATWADVPWVVRAADGALEAAWLVRIGEQGWAHGVKLARSRDDGATWEELGWLHDDTSATEHGFVSMVPAAGGTLAIWVDGREAPEGDPASLRAAGVDWAPAAGDVIDPRVCECCGTSAAATPRWVTVVYRDRSEEEIRDIWAVRGDAYGWSEPYRVAEDGWELEGCPVNGPALDAEKGRTAVAWFTAAEGVPRVRAALSADGGEQFGPPIEVGGGAGTAGRTAVAIEPEGTAVVAWVAPAADGAGGAAEPGGPRGHGGSAENRHENGGDGRGAGSHGPGHNPGHGHRAEDPALRGAVWLRRIGAGGALGEPVAVAQTTIARAGGFPGLLRRGDELWLTWLEPGRPMRLRFGRLARSEVPGEPTSTPAGGDSPAD